jgi:hypothetical protein
VGYPAGRGPGYVSGYRGVPSGQRRRPSGGYPGYGRRHRYGWGYDGWDGPWYWTEPWPDDGYYDVYDGDAPADGVEASGRWVRRGRQIILYGI